jgi:hypothetical protein
LKTGGSLLSPQAGVLPHQTGFGYRFDAIQTRDEIVAKAKETHPQLLLWADVVAANPKLPYLAPDDLLSLLKLISIAGVKIEVDGLGIPQKLEWPI